MRRMIFPFIPGLWSDMEYNIAIRNDNRYFRFRAGAIVICDGKMLFIRNKYGDYLYMLGGAVQIGETTSACIEREIEEEAGVPVRVSHLAMVVENFFHGVGGTIDGYECHTLDFYYYMDADPDLIARCRTTTDDDEEIVWVPVDQIKDSNIKPVCVKEHIDEIMGSKDVIHIINNL